MKRTIAYIRVSSRDGRQNTSIAFQEAEIREFCRENGYTLDKIFTECKSAHKGQPRKILNEALKYRKQQDCFLIALTVDRLTRTSKDIEVFSDHIDKIRVVNHGSNPMDLSIFTIFVGVAERESDMVSRRSKWGMEHAKKTRPQHNLGQPKYYNNSNARKPQDKDS